MRLVRSAIAAIIIVQGAAVAAQAQDHSGLYAPAELSRDARRLETAVGKIYELGLKPSLTAAEIAALGDFEFVFPMPDKDAFALDFFAYREDGKHFLAEPILSLKTLEDLASAYAWMQVSGYFPGTIDLYFTMLRRPDASGFPDGRYPPILPALGAPADPNSDPRVDSLSLSLRNEAFAFVIAHELGHVFHQHEEYYEVSVEQARADEIEADQFALDVLGRTGTPVVGALLLFQAQAYSLPHRGQFDSDEAWLKFLRERGTHPPTTDRLRGLARYTIGPLADSRPSERAIWSGIGQGMNFVADILDDRELQDCIVRAADKATMADLAPRTDPAGSLFSRACM